MFDGVPLFAGGSTGTMLGVGNGFGSGVVDAPGVAGVVGAPLEARTVGVGAEPFDISASGGIADATAVGAGVGAAEGATYAGP